MPRRTEHAGYNPDRTENRRQLAQWEGDWSGDGPVDMTGRPIKPGVWVAKAFQSGRSCNLEIRRVREVRPAAGNSYLRVFLDDSRVPVTYPGRCLIIDWDPNTGRLAA